MSKKVYVDLDGLNRFYNNIKNSLGSDGSVDLSSVQSEINALWMKIGRGGEDTTGDYMVIDDDAIMPRLYNLELQVQWIMDQLNLTEEDQQ